MVQVDIKGVCAGCVGVYDFFCVWGVGVGHMPLCLLYKIFLCGEDNKS